MKKLFLTPYSKKHNARLLLTNNKKHKKYRFAFRHSEIVYCIFIIKLYVYINVYI